MSYYFVFLTLFSYPNHHLTLFVYLFSDLQFAAPSGDAWDEVLVTDLEHGPLAREFKADNRAR